MNKFDLLPQYISRCKINPVLRDPITGLPQVGNIECNNMKTCNGRIAKQHRRLAKQNSGIVKPPLPRIAGANGTSNDGEIRRDTEDRND
jgi:hypothetical protein